MLCVNFKNKIFMRLTTQNSFQNLVLLNERTSTVLGSEKFRYGFNNMEADDEVKGEGNSYTTEFRQYDPRLGRWLSLDPLISEYPAISAYVFSLNSVLLYNDKGGDRPLPVQDTYKGKNWTIASGFGSRNVKGNARASKWHRGADINAGGGYFDYGAPVLATHDGIITKVHDATSGAGGRYITVTSADGTFQTKYLHLSKSDVIVGQEVKEGEQIGLIGASAFDKENGTASHLHYDIEVKQDGKFVKIDPQLDSDEIASTHNDINNLVDPQLWANGSVVVGTRDEPVKVIELEEVSVSAILPVTRLEPMKVAPVKVDESKKEIQSN